LDLRATKGSGSSFAESRYRGQEHWVRTKKNKYIFLCGAGTPVRDFTLKGTAMKRRGTLKEQKDQHWAEGPLFQRERGIQIGEIDPQASSQTSRALTKIAKTKATHDRGTTEKKTSKSTIQSPEKVLKSS